MSTPVLNVRAAGVTVAVTAVISTLIYKFGDLLELMFTPQVAASILHFSAQVVLVALIAIATVLVGWVITGFFRDLWLDPVIDPDTKKEKWEHEAKRLKTCSFIWTFLLSFAALSLRYIHAADWRTIAEQLLYIGVGAVLIGGASVPLYDIVVKRGWPRFIRWLYPTKLVQTPNGVEERDVTQPSNPETERTIVVPRPTPPKE